MTGGPRVVVVGLGNPVRSDDGVGLAVARELARLLALDPVEGLSVRASDRGGFELLDLVSGAGHAVIVDCLDTPAPRPGRCRLVTVENVAGMSRLVGAHDLSLTGVLELGRLLSLPMPGRVEVVGIEPADTTTLREQLTPAVAAIVGPVARWLHARFVLDASRNAPMHAALCPFRAVEASHGATPGYHHP